MWKDLELGKTWECVCQNTEIGWKENQISAFKVSDVEWGWTAAERIPNHTHSLSWNQDYFITWVSNRESL